MSSTYRTPPSANEFQFIVWVYLCDAAIMNNLPVPAPYPTLPQIVETREAL